MSTRPKLSRIIASQLPDFIREDYPTFVAFLEAYYEYLEQNDADLYNLRDIDKTLELFIEYFRNEVAPNLFNVATVDKRFLLSNIKDAHLAKGSESSFKLLFRLLYNKNVAVEYPGRQILRASDGKWSQDVSVFARINAGNPNDIVGKLVDIVTPQRVIKVLVDRRQDVEIEVDRFVQISEDVFEFYIDRRFFGDISVGDRLRYEGIFDATIVATTSKLDVIQKGKNFRPGQLYTIKNGLGSGSVVKIKRTDNVGGILSAEYIKYGIGYETNFTATILPRSGQTIAESGQTALSGSSIPNAVTSINIISGGSGYASGTTTVSLSGGGFTTAATIGEVTIVGGVITNIKVATPGSGYVTAPSVIISGGGTGAAATASVGEQSIYGIFETTTGFNEQGYINVVDYAQDVSNVWLPRTSYSTGDQLFHSNKLYTVTSGGITSSTPPSHTSGSEVNGTVTLEYDRVHGDAFDGTYSGEVVREFSYESGDLIINPEDPAIFRITIGPLAKYPGYFRSNDGFLDDAIFIQDSRYYQAYSYVLKIDEKLESYRSIVKTLVHPAGLALFGDYDIKNEFDIGVSLETMIKILLINVQDEISIAASISSKEFGKSVTGDSVSTEDNNVLTFNKSLSDSIESPTDLQVKLFGKQLSESFDITDSVPTKTLNKNLFDDVVATDVVNVGQIDKVSSDIVDISENAAITLTKYISDIDDTVSFTDSGNIFFNPYVEGNYWQANYTVGEASLF
jgi:hypothetical protein